MCCLVKKVSLWINSAEGAWIYILYMFSTYLAQSTHFCTVGVLVLRIWEIYALENAVFYIAVYGPYKPINFPYTQQGMFKRT